MLNHHIVSITKKGVHVYTYLSIRLLCTCRERDWSSKLKGKAYAEEMRDTVSKSIALGDEVLLRAEKSNKLSSYFCSSPFEVIRKTGVRLLSETTPDRRSPTLSPGHFSLGTRLEDYTQRSFHEEIPCPEESYCKRQ